MPKVRLGVLSNLYVNTGTYGSPTWTEIDLVADVSMEAAWDESESSVRRTQVHTFDPTMMTLGLTGRIRVDETDTGFTRLDDRFHDKGITDMLVLNGASTDNGARGFRFDGKVFSWTEDQALGNVLYKDFTIRPCASDNKVKRAIVSGGSPGFTDLPETPGT